MFIPDHILGCVALVGYRMADMSYRNGGSAFWVVRPQTEHSLANFSYLVTAKHIIQKVKDKGLEHVQVRVNLRDGGLKWIETQLSDWVLSPDSDVAAIQLGIPTALDHSGWPLGGCISDRLIKTNRIGIGHEVFMAGMFSRRLGNKKNIPIIRMGNIASVPSKHELVQTKLGPLEAYLIEARSIRGISGSPVFTDINSFLPHYQKQQNGPRFFLIGLMHGHFDVDDIGSEDAIDDGQKTTSVNMGISIVIPAEEIVKTIGMFDEKEKEALAKSQAKMLPTMDSDDEEVPSLTKAEFEDALRKASRKLSGQK